MDCHEHKFSSLSPERDCPWCIAYAMAGEHFMETAAKPTPEAMPGEWTLTAPDGRTWKADSPLRCASAEQMSRIPATIALARLARGLVENK